ncbi:D-alanine--D-alanine ligase [Candidatus Jorgensenbacteria bacterium]|nr:D-alanine--D-alanine ligase [Candidatus Jorgensenbacteria bacterium]
MKGSSGQKIDVKKTVEPKAKKIRVAVLMGGPSSEHEVSLKSGENVALAINREKHDVKKVLIDKKGKWEIPPEELAKQDDVAFVALHGTYGEDGTVQSELEAVGLPYTGSNALSSALAMNKFLSLRLLRDIGLETPLSFFVSRKEWETAPIRIFERIRYYLGYPVVIKPNDNGSSVGVTIVREQNELIEAMDEVCKVSRSALIQNFIRGIEVTCGVVDHGWSGSAFSLLPTEIVPKVSHFFDYRAKYETGGSLEITPARLPDSFIRMIQQIALKVHKAVDASGVSRTDMIIDRHGTPHVLEINTIPGFTKASLVPKAAEASGMVLGDLFDIMIRGALHRSSRRGA